MGKYLPRLDAPTASDKDYIKTTHGGYNYCINIKNGSCLPNCVGYAWGRWREILGAYHKLSRGNAENWWGNNDGYERGQTPRLGAVMCWRKGKAGNSADGAGHVAIVEKINKDGSVTWSNSDYGGKRWYTATKQAPYYLGKDYTFQGFIYLPITFDEEEEIKQEAEHVLKYKVGDKVVINGNLYKNGNAKVASGKVTNKVTTITRVAIGAKHPYNTKGDLGWMDETSIKLYTTEKEDKIEVGDKVSVIRGIQYNGKPFAVLRKSYDVIQISGNRVVIGVGKAVTAAVNIANLREIKK